MNEEEWLTAVVPGGMITFAASVASKRKLRLFTCACCRQVLNPFAPPLADRVLTAAEAFADGEISAATLAQVERAVGRVFAGASDAAQRGTGYLMHLSDACVWACVPQPGGGEEQAARKAAHATARAAADVPWPAPQMHPPEFITERVAQADLMRDIFGNPFREVACDPAWRTSDALALANAMYANRDFGAMPILADALQEAGCDCDDILIHCREDRKHARGCWVVDLLLGKK